jgi:hypothetical protein
MYCKLCGHSNSPESRFCEQCGAFLPETPADGFRPFMPSQAETPPPQAVNDASPPTSRRGKPESMRRKANVAAIVLAAVCVLLAAALALTMLGVTDAVFAPRKTFSTPEDAIRYFTERVQAGDYEGALKACAAGEIAQNYDYEAMIKRLKMMGYYTPSFMPGGYGLYAAYNEAAVKQQILSQLRFMALSVVLPDEYAEYLQGSQIIEDSGSIDFDSVVEDMDPEVFLGLKIADIGQSALADNDANADNLDAMANIYGAEEMAARDVLYEIDGDYYAGGFTLLQYNGSWLICQLGDPLIGQPATGALIPLKDE